MSAGNRKPRDSDDEIDREDRFSEREERHPALKDFNRTAFQIKHVFTKALKWGAIGAVALGLGAFAGTAIMGTTIAGGVIAAIASVKNWVFGNAVGEHGFFSGITDIFSGTVGSGVAMGGLGGLAVGLVTALSDAGDAADQEEERLMARYDQRQELGERRAAMTMQRGQLRDQQRMAMMQQEQELGLNPKFPMGRQREGQEQRDI